MQEVKRTQARLDKSAETSSSTEQPSVDHSSEAGQSVPHRGLIAAQNLQHFVTAEVVIRECTGCHFAELNEDHSICTTPDKHAELLSMQSCFAASFDLSADSECTYDSQISPASVLPEPCRLPLKV